jgi:hypothetical protein
VAVAAYSVFAVAESDRWPARIYRLPPTAGGQSEPRLWYDPDQEGIYHALGGLAVTRLCPP